MSKLRTFLSKRGKLSGLLFFISGAMLAWGLVTHGVAAVGSVPLIAAAAIATVTVGIQLAILFDGKHYGRKIGAALYAFYTVLTLLNVVLAAAGFAASLLADDLGRGNVVKALGNAQTEISSVTDALGSVSADAQRASAISDRKSRFEATSGGSCTAPGQAPSAKGIGPIANMREADEALFAGISADANRIAIEMRNASRAVDEAVSTYSADQHDVVIAAVRAALGQARASAAESQAIKRQALSRLAEWRAGQPIACHDPELVASIEALTNADYPSVADNIELPAAPTPDSAANDLFSDAAGVLQGEPFDLDMWGIPLAGGILPDVLLVLGFMMVTYNPDRKNRQRNDEEILAERLGLDPADAMLVPEALEAAAVDPEWQSLQADLVATGGRLFRVTRLHVAPDDWARLRSLRVLAERHLVYDVGLRDGFHVFVLRPAYLTNRFDQIVRRIVRQTRLAASLNASTSSEEMA